MSETTEAFEIMTTEPDEDEATTKRAGLTRRDGQPRMLVDRAYWNAEPVPTARVFLLWLNTTVLGVFASKEAAQREADELRASFGGAWANATVCRWTSGPHRTLEIEARLVHR